MAANTVRQEDLDWVKLRQDMDQISAAETMQQKAVRKFGENPVVPLGCAATVAALTYGVYNFIKGRSQMSQYMMRARVVAQGITIVAVLISLSAAVSRPTRKI